MTTSNEILVHSLVAIVDTYATFVASEGETTPTAYQCVQRLLQDAVGDDVKLDVPPDLLEGLELFIMRHTACHADSDHWEGVLGDLLETMDDLADNSNE